MKLMSEKLQLALMVPNNGTFDNVHTLLVGHGGCNVPLGAKSESESWEEFVKIGRFGIEGVFVGQFGREFQNTSLLIAEIKSRYPQVYLVSMIDSINRAKYSDYTVFYKDLPDKLPGILQLMQENKMKYYK